MHEEQSPTDEQVQEFLKKVISIEELPVFLHGAQETNRRKKIQEALIKISEKNN